MTGYVIDASVAIKWFLPLKAEESHLDQALHLLDLFLKDEITCYKPPHFIAEMVGVLTRLRPEKASANLNDLLNMDFQRVENTQVYNAACELSIRLKHHTFDTLYHAVALQTEGTILITADEAYYRKAQGIGHIILLQDYSI